MIDFAGNTIRAEMQTTHNILFQISGSSCKKSENMVSFLYGQRATPELKAEVILLW